MKQETWILQFQFVEIFHQIEEIYLIGIGEGYRNEIILSIKYLSPINLP